MAPIKKPSPSSHTNTTTNTTPEKAAKKNTPSKKTPNTSSVLKARLTNAKLLVIVAWMEERANLREVLRDLRHHKGQQKATSGRLELTGEQMRDRLKHYAKRYQKTKTYATFTGAGLDEEDEEKGFKKLGEKLDGMCPWYEKMDALLGVRPNVTPLFHLESTNDLGAPEEGQEGAASDADTEESEENDDEKERFAGRRLCVLTASAPTTQLTSNSASSTMRRDPAYFEFDFNDREEDPIIETEHSTEETQRTTADNQKKENSGYKKLKIKDPRMAPLALAADSQELGIAGLRNNMATAFQESLAGKTAALERMEMAKLEFEKEKWEATNTASAIADKIKLETDKWRSLAESARRYSPWEKVVGVAG
ncbi:hypothetical protein BDK51DRAFT_38982 [Blyttiomyces helicus]|uniref:Uncharacterized protein n=1 Tax=Blyttiomyces helicus TaxID=388810 RepID=A0A4P9WSG6_9FUNG|nr:hypothetical protein BDK51DRAFT_38982 [Blyttiomyces helicus]|eukprot:RKO94250.1 hypothetical protein BDK51DRAFT_38982 [Blyttiomyces helicus]